MAESNDTSFSADRREFLGQVSAGILAGLALSGDAAAEAPPAEAAPAKPEPQAMPTIPFGKSRISRLVAGHNPIGGYSYMGHHMDQHMREYFTVERIVQYLQDCRREGVTAHQFSVNERMPEALRLFRQRGGSMQLIYLLGERAEIKDAIAAYQPAAIAHHGGVTDRLFREGKSRLVHDFVKEARDRGVMAGVSAHNPDCIKRVADEGWEVDFFMTCFYHLTRPTPPTPGGQWQTLEIAYPFVRSDPVEMTKVVRQVKQPCLAFKILGAGRLCGSQQAVKDAFEFAFRNIKPTDGVIVGMYQRFFDEIRANALYARQCGALPAPPAGA